MKVALHHLSHLWMTCDLHYCLSPLSLAPVARADGNSVALQFSRAWDRILYYLWYMILDFICRHYVKVNYETFRSLP